MSADRVQAVAYLDAHNHLQDEWLAPHLDQACRQLEELGLRRAVVNGTCEADWDRVTGLALRYAWVVPSYGLHPWLVGNRTDGWYAKLVERLDADPRAGVGEIGLDRWILESARKDDVRLAGLRRASLDEQLAVFRQQLGLATERNLPMTVHCLDAWGALQAVFAETPLPARGFLLHAYGGSLELAQQFVRRGAYFSFNGYFLGERKEKQQRVFRELPLDRLLVETDAPSMPPPQAWRTYRLPPAPAGSPLNHPCNIEAVYSGLASLLKIPVGELSDRVEENFQRLFG